MYGTVNAHGTTHGQPLLSICIPTYNRSRYLREILPQLLQQVEKVNDMGASVELLVSDNHSPDDTERYVKEWAGSRVSYYRNRVNIGADRNFLACVRRARGVYVWLFGDDELVLPNGIAAVVRVLRQSAPALVILYDPGILPSVDSPAEYSDYASCIRAATCSPSAFALSHGLITRNVFKKTSFSMRTGHQMVQTNHGHMYGLIEGVRHGGTIVLLNGVIQVRQERPDYAQWPGNRWGNLCIKQARYMHYVGQLFCIPELNRAARNSVLHWPVECLYVAARRTGTVLFFRAIRKALFSIKTMLRR